MDEAPKELETLSVRELEEKLEQAETKLKDINEAAELAFKVIKEKENIVLDDMSAIRAEIKKRSGRS
tara:strand:+ start:376 stop:576 length:201 start_codon:yes stop_codon:yes gene_type:complete